MVFDFERGCNLADIGSNIRVLRESNGLTQEQLARESRITMGMISKLERGESSNPTLETLQKIAAGLGVSVASLLEEPKAKAS